MLESPLKTENPLPMALIVVGVKVSFGDNDRSFSSFLHDRLMLG